MSSQTRDLVRRRIPMERKSLKAREVMSRNRVWVGTETKVSEIVRLLAQDRIGSVPVLDKEGRLPEVVTERDLFPREKPYPFSVEKGPALLRQGFATPPAPARSI